MLRHSSVKKNESYASERKPRLLVTRFNSAMHTDVIRILRDRGFEIVYWERPRGSAATEGFDPGEFPNAIFHSGYEARMGKPAIGVDVASFEPPSKDLIHAMHECESQVLTMMNVEDLHGRVSILKRKNLYYEYLKYWRGVLLSYKIDAVISADIPHVSFQYVLYCIARHLGIPFIMCRMTKAGARYLIIDDIADYRILREESLRIGSENHTAQDLSKDLERYYRKHAEEGSDPTPYYVKDFMRKGDFRVRHIPSFSRIWKRVKNFTFFSAVFANIKSFIAYNFGRHQLGDLQGFNERGYMFRWHDYVWGKIKKRFRKNYEELEREPDFSKKFIYFPLHNQPEASTSAMGGVFVNQFLAIDMLAAALPHGWELYVKENPGQWIMPRTHVGRFSGFYEDIAGLNNVRLVPQRTSTFELIRKSEAVAAVTSFACLEGLIRGKPALLFGNVWFMHCDGVLNVKSFLNCVEGIQKIIAGYKPDSVRVLNYFLALDRVSFESFHNRRSKTGLGIDMSEAENSHVLAGAFEAELKKQLVSTRGRP